MGWCQKRAFRHWQSGRENGEEKNGDGNGRERENGGGVNGSGTGKELDKMKPEAERQGKNEVVNGKYVCDAKRSREAHK
ncbi:hypothetical protein WR25_08750 [Diploscapter pachys]|uniref:Uncharacterized protein n=1 Tax=Diploscapter pachys TaxID=2018661 RepID=A0A2A2KJZ4_9BILA|nr:hypothetical protein WR25_08750 [Diploscapter pachys]